MRTKIKLGCLFLLVMTVPISYLMWKGLGADIWSAIDREDLPRIASMKTRPWVINSPSLSGTTPLMYALEHRKRGAYLELLKSGADPNKMLLHGRIKAITLLACTEKDKYWIEMALKHGGDPNLIAEVSAYRRYTPLNLAINARSLEIVELLVMGGADINFHSENISCPLAQATYCDLRIVLYLLKQGADFRIKEKGVKSFVHSISGKRPEDYVQDSDKKLLEEIREFLRQHGVDPDKIHKEGDYYVWD